MTDTKPNPTATYVLFALTAAAMANALYAIFLKVPTEATMGVVQRIFYFHVPSAWVGFLAFVISGIASIGWLATKKYRWDRWAVSAAEVGVLYTTVVLVTGPIWARPVWGIWWTWDARLTSTFILWLIYVSYLILRGFLDEPGRRASVSAVFSILGLIDVPIVYMSIRWWRTQHPQPVVAGGEGSGLAPEMWSALLQALFALLALFAFLMHQRVQLEKARQEVEALRREVLT